MKKAAARSGKPRICRSRRKPPDGMRRFSVTVTETFTTTVDVIAEDEEQAECAMDEWVNDGTVDPSQDPAADYDREITVEEAE